MPKRYLSLWFRYLLTDWKARRISELKGTAYAFIESERGRKILTAVSPLAAEKGAAEGMTVADAQLLISDLQFFDAQKGRNVTILKGLAEWCLRYTPLIAIDLPDGLLLDITGCSHLKGGEAPYIDEIAERLKEIGYDVRPAIADTIGAAWGIARYSKASGTALIIPPNQHRHALLPLPPSALRLSPDLLLKLQQVGLYTINSFVHMPKTVLRRRFGKDMVLRLLQALGTESEFLLPLKESVPYAERLDCLEAIRTRPAIETALQTLLDRLCKRLYSEGLGIRAAILSWYRVDGKNGVINIGTSQASHRAEHLFKLFLIKLDTIAPGLGIELFILEAPHIEPTSDKQNDLWAAKPGLDSKEVSELIDRLSGRIGTGHIKRYLPAEHYWPERSAEPTPELQRNPESHWQEDKPRPMQLLDKPDPIDAMAQIPDHPPIHFTWKGQRHNIIGADGPERIEREWWLEPGEHRDYYVVEDEEGRRYWIFRSGHYSAQNIRHWYLHGFFA